MIQLFQIFVLFMNKKKIIHERIFSLSLVSYSMRMIIHQCHEIYHSLRRVSLILTRHKILSQEFIHNLLDQIYF